MNCALFHLYYSNTLGIFSLSYKQYICICISLIFNILHIYHQGTEYIFAVISDSQLLFKKKKENMKGKYLTLHSYYTVKVEFIDLTKSAKYRVEQTL